MFRKITWWRHQIGNIFRATGPLCGEFAGHRWIPLTKASDAIYAWTNGLVNRRDAGDLGRHRAHYEVTVMDSAWQGLDEIREHAVMCFVICEKKKIALVTVVVTTRTTRTPSFWGYPPPPHDYPHHWVILDPKSKEDKVKVTNLKNSPKFQIVEFWNGHYTRHTFWSCLIRCANMKWIRWVFLKIQSGHDSVHRRTDGRTDRRTDGQGDTSIPPFQLRWSRGIITVLVTVAVCSDCRNFWQNKTSPSKSLQCTRYNYQQPPVKSLKPSDAYMRQ